MAIDSANNSQTQPNIPKNLQEEFETLENLENPEFNRQNDLIQDEHILGEILRANTSDIFQSQSEIDGLTDQFIASITDGGLTLEEYVVFKNKVAQTKKATSEDYKAILEGTFVGKDEEDKEEKIAQTQNRLIRDLVAFDKTNVTEDSDTAGGIFDVSDANIDAFMSANNIPDNLKGKLQEIIEARKETRRQNFLGTTNENSNTPEEIQNILARYDKRHGTNVLDGNQTDIKAFIDTWGFSANDLKQAQEIIDEVVSNYKKAEKPEAYKEEVELLDKNNLLKVTQCGKQTVDLTNTDDLHAYLIQTLFGDTDTLNGIQAQQLHNAKTVIKNVFGDRTDVTPDEFIRKLGHVKTGDITTKSIENLMQVRGEQPSKIPPIETPPDLKSLFTDGKLDEDEYEIIEKAYEKWAKEEKAKGIEHQWTLTDAQISDIQQFTKAHGLKDDEWYIIAEKTPIPFYAELQLLKDNNLIQKKQDGTEIVNLQQDPKYLEAYLKATTGSEDQAFIDKATTAIEAAFSKRTDVTAEEFLTSIALYRYAVTEKSVKDFIETVEQEQKTWEDEFLQYELSEGDYEDSIKGRIDDAGVLSAIKESLKNDASKAKFEQLCKDGLTRDEYIELKKFEKNFNGVTPPTEEPPLDLKSLFSNGELSDADYEKIAEAYEQWAKAEAKLGRVRSATLIDAKSANRAEIFAFCMANGLTNTERSIIWETTPAITDGNNNGIEDSVDTQMQPFKITSTNASTEDNSEALNLFKKFADANNDKRVSQAEFDAISQYLDINSGGIAVKNELMYLTIVSSLDDKPGLSDKEKEILDDAKALLALHRKNVGTSLVFTDDVLADYIAAAKTQYNNNSINSNDTDNNGIEDSVDTAIKNLGITSSEALDLVKKIANTNRDNIVSKDEFDKISQYLDLNGDDKVVLNELEVLAFILDLDKKPGLSDKEKAIYDALKIHVDTFKLNNNGDAPEINNHQVEGIKIFAQYHFDNSPDTDLKSLFSDGKLSEVEKAQANDFYAQWVEKTKSEKGITRPSTMSADSIETYLFAMQKGLTDKEWALLTGTSSDIYPEYTDPNKYIDNSIQINFDGEQVFSMNRIKNAIGATTVGTGIDDYLALKLFGATKLVGDSSVSTSIDYLLSEEQQRQLDAAKDIIYNHFGDDAEFVPVEAFKHLMARLSSLSYQQGSPSF